MCFTAITLSQFMEKDYYSLYLLSWNFLGISNPEIGTSMVVSKARGNGNYEDLNDFFRVKMIFSSVLDNLLIQISEIL